jgi:hypothetical protein
MKLRFANELVYQIGARLDCIIFTPNEILSKRLEVPISAFAGSRICHNKGIAEYLTRFTILL